MEEEMLLTRRILSDYLKQRADMDSEEKSIYKTALKMIITPQVILREVRK